MGLMQKLRVNTWLKNSCSRQSSQGSATAIGLASLEISLTFTMIFISWEQEPQAEQPGETSLITGVTSLKVRVSLPLPCGPCF